MPPGVIYDITRLGQPLRQRRIFLSYKCLHLTEIIRSRATKKTSCNLERDLVNAAVYDTAVRMLAALRHVPKIGALLVIEQCSFLLYFRNNPQALIALSLSGGISPQLPHI